MSTFYSRPGGSQGFQILSNALPNEDWQKLKNSVIRLLKAKNFEKGVELLSNTPFTVFNGTKMNFMCFIVKFR